MRILLGCENASIVERWSLFLADQGAIEVATSTEDVVKQAASNGINLILLHSSLVNIEICQEIRRRAPEAKLFILSDQPSAEEGVEFLRYGVVGYGNTYISQTRLLEALHVITAAGGIWVGQKVIQKFIVEVCNASMKPEEAMSGRDPSLSVLTQMERKVAMLIARGMTNLEIAAELAITERTVKAHLSAIYEKLHLGNRLSLALLINRATTNSA